MPKERIYDNLTPTNILIEAEILKRARLEKMNISEVCRNCILKALNDPILLKKYDKFAKVPEKIKKLVLEIIKNDPANVPGCLRILKRQSGLTFGSLEFLEWVDKQDD